MNIEADINLLMTDAIKEIKDAFTSGNSLLFGQLGKKYGPIAHRVYMFYHDQCYAPGVGFFDDEFKPVMLDPRTVLGRSRELVNAGKDGNPDDPEFWDHADLIKSLVEYLRLARCNVEEGCYGSA